MKHYSIHIEVDRKNPTTDQITNMQEYLERGQWSPAVGRSPHGYLDFQLTVPAEGIVQAVMVAVATVQQIAGATAVHVDALPEPEFDRRQGFEITTVPTMFSVTDAASVLGVSRQRVLQLIDDGAFPGAQKVGTTWVIPEQDVNKRVTAPYYARQDPEVHYEGNLPS